MKKSFLFSFTLIALFLIAAFSNPDIASIAIGTALPQGELKLQDISGKNISLMDAKKENGLLVVFSSNTCPFVIKQESSILETGRLAKESKVGYVVINSNESQRAGVDSFDEMKKYAKNQGYDFPYTVDVNSVLADAFGATRTPEAFLFDKNMKLVYKGAFTDDTDPKMAKVFYLKDAVSSLRDGKEIPVNTTKSVGCSIKRIKKDPN